MNRRIRRGKRMQGREKGGREGGRENVKNV
jgi:hypothetical protein